jgi:putative NADH-flavin reductase
MAQPLNLTAGVTSDDGRSAIATKTHHLLVIGATRHTGKQVLQQGLAAGHTVTALARDAARIEPEHELLRVVRGDVLDSATVAPAIAGCDAVVSCLGVTSAYRAPTTLYSEGVRNIMQAMRGAGVQRLLVVSAVPVGRGEDDTLFNRVRTRLLWALFKELYADMARMEEVVRASDLDWTIVRPPRLTNKPATGRYRTAFNRGVRGGSSIGRADLAGALLRLLDDPGSSHATIGIAY